MIELWRLEVVKLTRWRTVLYLLLPNLGALGYTGALLAAVLMRREYWIDGLGLLLTGFIRFHWLVGGTYAMGALMLCADLWCSEAADRTLRTLVLMQVSRGSLLAVRTAAVTLVMLASASFYFAQFFADAVLVRSAVSPAVWEKLQVPIGDAMLRMIPYGAGLSIGLATLVLFFTLISLGCTRPSTSTMLSSVALIVLAFGLPERVQPFTFPHAFSELTGRDVLHPLANGDAGWTEPLATSAGILGVNAMVLWVTCRAAFARKELF